MMVIRFVHSKVPNPEISANKVQRPEYPTLENLGQLLESEMDVDNAWDMLGTLFGRQWWQRVWCVQEAILAKKIAIMCGPEQVDGKLIAVFTRWYFDQRCGGQLPPKGFDGGGIRSVYWRLNKWPWTENFYRILDRSRGLQATNPRDKVYALLGLLQLNAKENDIYKWNIGIDYHKSVQEVIFDSVVCSIRLEGNLQFLSCIDHPDLEPRRDYPSWMPRWDETGKQSDHRLWCDSSSFSAGRGVLSMDDNWTYSDKLTLRGLD